MELDDILIIGQGPKTLREIRDLAVETVKVYQESAGQLPLRNKRSELQEANEVIQIAQANIIISLVEALLGEK